MLEKFKRVTRVAAPLVAFGYILDNAILGVSRHAILTGNEPLLDGVRNYATNYSPLFYSYTNIPKILDGLEKTFNFPINHDINITAAFLIPALAIPILSVLTAQSLGLYSRKMPQPATN